MAQDGAGPRGRAGSGREIPGNRRPKFKSISREEKWISKDMPKRSRHPGQAHPDSDCRLTKVVSSKRSKLHGVDLCYSGTAADVADPPIGREVF